MNKKEFLIFKLKIIDSCYLQICNFLPEIMTKISYAIKSLFIAEYKLE